MKGMPVLSMFLKISNITKRANPYEELDPAVDAYIRHRLALLEHQAQPSLAGVTGAYGIGGGLLGATLGAAQAPGKNFLQGAGRGLVRGAVTGGAIPLAAYGGASLGNAIGGPLGGAIGGLAGAGLGGVGAYKLTGNVLGSPGYERKKKQEE